MSYNFLTHAWNERVGPGSAHIVVNEVELFKSYEKSAWGLDFTGKKLLDYGCGGGFFGKWLFERWVLQHYTAVDLAPRSLKAAEKNLEFVPDELKTFILMEPDHIPVLRGHDIISCLSVVQHIPDQRYLIALLHKLNESGASHILMTCKYSEKTVFQNLPYKGMHEINCACLTNARDLQKGLSNYIIEKKTEAELEKYQYILFRSRV